VSDDLHIGTGPRGIVVRTAFGRETVADEARILACVGALRGDPDPVAEYIADLKAERAALWDQIDRARSEAATLRGMIGGEVESLRRAGDEDRAVMWEGLLVKAREYP